MTGFAQYLLALLSRPYKTSADTEIEKWLTAFGMALNGQKEAIFQVRRAWLVQTATGAALDALGLERGLPRLAGEDDPTYRGRLIAAFVQQKGTAEAMLDAFRKLGFASGQIEELFKTDPLRWSEFKVTLDLASPSLTAKQRASVLSAIASLKPAHTKLAGLDLAAPLPAAEDALEWRDNLVVMLHGCPLPSEGLYPSETLYPC